MSEKIQSLKNLKNAEPRLSVLDGVSPSNADNLTQINAAIAAAVQEMALPAGDILVSEKPNNLRGIQLSGPGRLLKPITGGNQQINSYADKNQFVTGREYLSAFHKKIMARSGAKMVFSGDSTTAGDSLSSSAYQIHALLQKRALNEGYFSVTGVNAGHSGHSTINWLSTWLAADLATNPDLYVIRWGINDPYLTGANLTVSQFLTNIRNGLATLRGSKTLAQMSIVLQMPNSTNDTPGARDEKWYEAIVQGMKQAARDYQACFVDTYGYLRDSRSADDWMDNPYGDGRHIHPNDVMNLWIASMLGDVVFPSGLRYFSENRMTNAAGTGAGGIIKVAADAISTYPKGVSMYRATPAGNGANWPFDGVVLTHNHADGVQLQINYPYIGVTDSFAFRLGQAGIWKSWVLLGGSTNANFGNWTPTILGSATAGVNTYTNQIGEYIELSGVVTASFRVTLSAKDAAMAGNISIGGLPFNPVFTASNYPSVQIARYNGVTLTAGYSQLAAQGVGNGTMLLIQNGSNVNSAALSAAAVAGNVDLYGSITYRK